MYPNQQPPFGSGFNSGYPQQPQFGAGQQQYPGMPQPGMPQPFGGGYPPMQQPMTGMHQPGMPQPGMPQPFNYQAPPVSAPGYPAGPPAQPSYGSPHHAGFSPPQQHQPGPNGFAPQQTSGFAPQQTSGFAPAQSGFPPQQQPAYQPYGQPPSQPVYPQLPNQGSFGQVPVSQQHHQQSHQSPPYGGSAPPSQYGQAYAPAQHMKSQPRGRPTVVAAPNFNAATDAGTLRKAMKGFGTDEDAIIEVLCRRTNAQRMEIIRTYKTAYGKDLLDDIRSETSGNFENLLIALLTHSTELYARELFEAMYGEGTDEDVLIEVMCTMSNEEIRAICWTFQRMYGKSLEQELKSDTSGNFKRLMTSLSCASRDESMVTDVNSARTDAEELKRAGIDKWGTDESVFNRILCLRNYEQIKLVAQEYEKLTGHTLEKDIKREFSGDIEDGLLSILRVAQNRTEFFARRLHKTMAGIGTNDKSLVRLVVSRSEIDMVDIKEQFQRYYGKSLKSFVKGDTSGHYKHALYALIGENRS